MAKDKKSFLLYADLINVVEKLPSDKAGELFKHVLRYVNDLNPITDDILVEIAFEPIKQALKRDLAKYESIVERNRVNGQKGGRKDESKITQMNPKEPTGLFGNPKEPTGTQKNPNVTDNDNDSDNDNDNGIDNGIGIENNITLNKINEIKISVEPVSKKDDIIIQERKNDLKKILSKYFDEKYITKSNIDKVFGLTKKYAPVQIVTAIENAKQNDFWSANFLSPAKLTTKDKSGVSYIDLFLNLKNNGKSRNSKDAEIDRGIDELKRSIVANLNA